MSEDKLELANALHKMAIMQEDQGSYEEARTLFENSLKIREELGNKPGMIKSFGQLGNIECKLENYTKAKTYYEKCLELSKEIGDNSSIAKVLHQMAILQEEQKNYAQAQELYIQSLDIEKQLGDLMGIASTLGQLGRLAEAQNNLPVAAGFYEIACVLFQKLKSPYAELVGRWLDDIKQNLTQEEIDTVVKNTFTEFEKYLIL